MSYSTCHCPSVNVIYVVLSLPVVPQSLPRSICDWLQSSNSQVWRTKMTSQWSSHVQILNYYHYYYFFIHVNSFLYRNLVVNEWCISPIYSPLTKANNASPRLWIWITGKISGLMGRSSLSRCKLQEKKKTSYIYERFS